MRWEYICRRFSSLWRRSRVRIKVEMDTIHEQEYDLASVLRGKLFGSHGKCWGGSDGNILSANAVMDGLVSEVVCVTIASPRG